jgi:hypothetical protein
MKSKGLGDSIHKFTHKTGINKIVDKGAKALGVDDCGCSERRDTLNRLMPYKKNKR